MLWFLTIFLICDCAKYNENNGPFLWFFISTKYIFVLSFKYFCILFLLPTTIIDVSASKLSTILSNIFFFFLLIKKVCKFDNLHSKIFYQHHPLELSEIFS